MTRRCHHRHRSFNSHRHPASKSHKVYMQISDLPFEILECIFSELSTASLWGIREVNRAFYHTAAKRLFKCVDVNLSYPPSRGYLQTLQGLTWVATKLERMRSTDPLSIGSLTLVDEMLQNVSRRLSSVSRPTLYQDQL